MLFFGMTMVEDTYINRDRRIEWCIEGLANGHTTYLAELYEHTHVPVYSFALSILKNTQDAEDVLHDCYLRICTSAADYKPKGKPMAWVLTITRNLCLKKIGQSKRRADLPEDMWENMFPDTDRLSHEDRLILRECLNRLSDEERQIVVLHALSGFKHREIASLMDAPLPTVLSKYSRAMKKLQKILAEESESNEESGYRKKGEERLYKCDT